MFTDKDGINMALMSQVIYNDGDIKLFEDKVHKHDVQYDTSQNRLYIIIDFYPFNILPLSLQEQIKKTYKLDLTGNEELRFNIPVDDKFVIDGQCYFSVDKISLENIYDTHLTELIECNMDRIYDLKQDEKTIYELLVEGEKQIKSDINKIRKKRLADIVLAQGERYE